jgi:hypothetical protein
MVMRRVIAAGGAVALGIILVLGTLQATAAAPYVYACSQVSFYIGGPTTTNVTIYNGTATTANITFKALAFDGTNLNAALSITTTFTVAPTKTHWTVWTNPSTHNPVTENVMPSTVRVVSDQPVEVFANPMNGSEDNVYPCILQQQS